MQRKNLNKNQRSKLQESFKVASEIFFTDRAQSLYEAGRHSYFASLPDAELRLSEAFSAEPDNALILWGLVMVRLKHGQCDQAQEVYLNLPKEIQEEKSLFAPLQAYCLKKSLPFWSDEKAPSFMQHFFKGIFLYGKGALPEALAELQKARKAEGDFPETLYWIWKIDPKEAGAVSKYKRDCETQKTQLIKKFEDFPQVCQFLHEVSGLEFGHEI